MPSPKKQKVSSFPVLLRSLAIADSLLTLIFIIDKSSSMLVSNGKAKSVGSFSSHTAVFSLGLLARTMLRRAFDDNQVAASHRRWLKEQRKTRNERTTETLVSAGFDTGVASLLSRAQSGEFALVCEHREFNATLAIGFDTQRAEINGVLLANLEGDVMSAIAFANTLHDHLLQSRASSANSVFTKNETHQSIDTKEQLS